jgi:hypothetical protein
MQGLSKNLKNMILKLTNSVHPQSEDFDSGQGLRDFETGEIAYYFEDFKRAKTPPTSLHGKAHPLNTYKNYCG